MTTQRKDDQQARTWFRAERFHRHEDQWYFTTREGTDEGPFELRSEAELRLADYIRVMTSGWLPSERAVEASLALEPLDATG